MQFRTESITQGVVRLRLSASFQHTLMERYGIIDSAPCGDAGFSVSREAIHLPGGRSLAFECWDGQQNPDWQARLSEMKEHFRDRQGGQRVIIGDPRGSSRNQAPVERGEHTPFGISIAIGEEERFYGLGEGNGESLNLRGGKYQNWAYYKFDEAPIPFLMSAEGWGILINNDWKHFVDVGARQADRLEIMGEDGELDLFILYGVDMQGVLQAYGRLTGHNLLLPKWAYGLTYIAPIYANQFEVTTQARMLRDKHIPCDMISLEPGWMTKFYDHGLDKEWELTRFHMPHYRQRPHQESFITALKRYGFHVKLWLCVDYDLSAEEERIVRGEAKCDPPAWFDHLEPFVEDGVDAFKIDPCELVYEVHPDMHYQNGACDEQMHNINQVLIAKQMYQGFAKKTGRRPMHHYCGGYAGTHRWGAMTTGDNGGRQGALTWLLNLAMSGVMNVSCDMDVHSLEAIHFGLLLPWGHLNSWYGYSQPWWAGDDLEQAFTDYDRLRYRLLPYLYSTAIEGHEEDMPMIRPMPLAFPDCEQTLDSTAQYMLGPWLMVTVFERNVFLPEGEWQDFWTGEIHNGPCTLEYAPPPGRGGGLFIRRGAILPTWKDRDFVGQYDDQEIILDLYPYGESRYTLREDDGESLDYACQQSCRTEIRCEALQDETRVVIGQRDGVYAGKPEKRTWLVRVHGSSAPVKIVLEASQDEARLILADGQ